VQSLFPDGRVPDEPALGVDVHSVFQCRRPQHSELGGEIVGHALDDDRVASERKVRPMLLARSNRQNQSRIFGENRLDLHRDELLDSPRVVLLHRNDWRMRRRFRRCFVRQLGWEW